jgi:hypothetical protein
LVLFSRVLSPFVGVVAVRPHSGGVGAGVGERIDVVHVQVYEVVEVAQLVVAIGGKQQLRERARPCKGHTDTDTVIVSGRLRSRVLYYFYLELKV